jgi:hypothetical protein
VARSKWAVSIGVLALLLAAIAVITTAASSRGACGQVEFQRSCGRFGGATVFYGLVAIDLVTALCTGVLLLFRRKPPKLPITSSILIAGAVGTLFLPAIVLGKLGGAVLIMALPPVVAVLVLSASICSALWVAQAITRIPKRIVH